MPYVSYTQILDEDIDALWAWNRSLEPSDNEPPEHEMMFPANIRQGLAVWQAVQFEAGRFEPAEDRDEEYNRGAYLVEALGHCSSCHTPRNVMFGQDEDRRYTGAEIHGWYAPAIAAGCDVLDQRLGHRRARPLPPHRRDFREPRRPPA